LVIVVDSISFQLPIAQLPISGIVGWCRCCCCCCFCCFIGRLARRGGLRGRWGAGWRRFGFVARLPVVWTALDHLLDAAAL